MIPYSSPACLAVAFLLGLAGLNTLPSCLRAPDFCAAKTADLLAASLDNSSVVTVCLKKVQKGHSRFLSHWHYWYAVLELPLVQRTCRTTASPGPCVLVLITGV